MRSMYACTECFSRILKIVAASKQDGQAARPVWSRSSAGASVPTPLVAKENCLWQHNNSVRLVVGSFIFACPFSLQVPVRACSREMPRSGLETG